MFIAIVRHTPIWVWGLLAALVALGLLQTRDREMRLTRVTILPLAMIALSLSGVFSAFGHLPLALGGWAVGVGAALGIGRQFIMAHRAVWSPRDGKLHVPGSWLPLVLIVALFSFKYFAGASLALHPELATDAAFAGPMSLAYGSFSGLFLARGLALRNVVNRPAELRVA